MLYKNEPAGCTRTLLILNILSITYEDVINLVSRNEYGIKVGFSNADKTTSQDQLSMKIKRFD